MSMHHPLLGEITYDRDQEGWIGRLSLPAMAGWHMRHRIDVGIEENWDTDHTDLSDFAITIETPKNCRPTPEQDAALRSLIHNPEQYAHSIMAELARVARGRLEYERPTAPDEQVEFDATVKRLRLDQPEGMTDLVELSYIRVLDDAEDGQSHLVFEFGHCGWDAEHGVSVLVHAGDALDSSGQCEFHARRKEQRRVGGCTGTLAGLLLMLVVAALAGCWLSQ